MHFRSTASRDPADQSPEITLSIRFEQIVQLPLSATVRRFSQPDPGGVRRVDDLVEFAFVLPSAQAADAR